MNNASLFYYYSLVFCLVLCVFTGPTPHLWSVALCRHDDRTDDGRLMEFHHLPVALFNLFFEGAKGHLCNLSRCRSDCKQISLLSIHQSTDYGWVLNSRNARGLVHSKQREAEERQTKNSRTQKQKQLPGNYSQGQIYQAAITDFKGVPSPTPAHVLHILPCLKTSCWICNVNASHFNSITSTHSGVDGAKEARGAERASGCSVFLRAGGK